jgi:hypothetical protein
MPKLTDGHIEQIRNMKNDGKTYQEIREWFWQTYKIKIWDSEIAKICRGLKKTAKKIKSKVKTRAEDKPAASGDEFVDHIRAAYAAFKKKFLQETENVIKDL